MVEYKRSSIRKSFQTINSSSFSSIVQRPHPAPTRTSNPPIFHPLRSSLLSHRHHVPSSPHRNHHCSRHVPRRWNHHDAREYAATNKASVTDNFRSLAAVAQLASIGVIPSGSFLASAAPSVVLPSTSQLSQVSRSPFVFHVRPDPDS